MTVLQAFVDGLKPPMALVLSAQKALQQSVDVYRPPSKELQSRLKEADMDVSEARCLPMDSVPGRASAAWAP